MPNVQVTHIRQDNYQLLFHFDDNSIVLWVDEAVLLEEGVQQKLQELYNDHVKILFVRDLISLNDVVHYLEMDRKHMNVIPASGDLVGILAFKKEVGGSAELVEVYAENLDLKQDALMKASERACDDDFWE